MKKLLISLLTASLLLSLTISFTQASPFKIGFSYVNDVEALVKDFSIKKETIHEERIKFQKQSFLQSGQALYLFKDDITEEAIKEIHAYQESYLTQLQKLDLYVDDTFKAFTDEKEKLINYEITEDITSFLEELLEDK